MGVSRKLSTSFDCQLKRVRRALKMHLKNVLPEEILLEIFSVNEKSDLQKFLEISREWRDLLIRNAKVMRKLPLILMNETWREKIKFVEKYGKYIRRVEFVNTKVESFDDVLKVLELTPNVESLSLINVRLAQAEISESLAEDLNEDEETIDDRFPKMLLLKKLKEVVVEDPNNVGSLRFISSHCEMLARLKCDLTNESNLVTLTDLLTSNHQLKELELITDLDEVFAPSEAQIDGFTVQLDKLIVNAIVMKYNEQFLKFLTSQSHLKEIGLIAEHVDFRYHQMMFTTFPAVEKIQLNIDAVGTNDCLTKLRKIPPNKSLKSLTLLGANLHLNVFDSVINLCPKISQLNIHNLTQFYSNKIKTLPLTQLQVEHANLEPEKSTQSTRIQLTNITESGQKEIYERNLQSFCDFSRFGDNEKSKDILETGIIVD